MNIRNMNLKPLELRIFILVLAMNVIALTLPAPSPAASKFPEKPVTLIVGFSPGGSVDNGARSIQPYLQKYLGVSVLIENKPGNSGLIAGNYAARMKPDGYNLFVGSSGTALMTIVFADNWKPGKPLVDSFIPIYCWLNGDGNGIFVKKDSPWKTMDDLAAEAQKRPVKLAIGGGWTTTDSVMAQMIRKAYGGQWILVPEDSGGVAVAGVLGGHYDCGSAGPAIPAMDPGTVRLLAVSMDKRSGRWPDTPTFAEIGKPEVSILHMLGAMAPLGTPPEVIAKLEDAFNKARNDPGYLAWAQKTKQVTGDKGWDGKTFYNNLKKYTNSVKEMVPLLQAEIHRAQQGK